jgi:hypothetical protein
MESSTVGLAEETTPDVAALVGDTHLAAANVARSRCYR